MPRAKALGVFMGIGLPPLLPSHPEDVDFVHPHSMSW